ncbi:MAG: hypothetical protein Fur0046_31850 [Cyanobacteria bacterium J069]|nr:MAG: hypothetical protein D6742_12005 [Cyanobacteria bacterium J069]
MPLPDDIPAWEINPNAALVPLRFDDELVGFLKPSVAARVIDILNEEARSRKALRLACYDLVSRAGGSSSEIEPLVSKYLARAARPKSGVRAIARWLKQRQSELGVTDAEFERFCDSYRLPKEKLDAIFAGEIDGSMLTPLARVLGCSIEDVMKVLEG